MNVIFIFGANLSAVLASFQYLGFRMKKSVNARLIIMAILLLANTIISLISKDYWLFLAIAGIIPGVFLLKTRKNILKEREKEVVLTKFELIYLCMAITATLAILIGALALKNKTIVFFAGVIPFIYFVALVFLVLAPKALSALYVYKKCKILQKHEVEIN